MLEPGDQLAVAGDNGFISSQDRKLFRYADTAEEAWRIIARQQQPFRRRRHLRGGSGFPFTGPCDRDDLLSYVRAVSPRPSRMFIVHGEDRQACSLAAAIRAEHPGLEVTVPDASAIYACEAGEGMQLAASPVGSGKRSG